MSTTKPAADADQWASFCDNVKATGMQILATGAEADSVNKSEGLRYLARIFTSACEAAIRNWMANPAHRADRHGKFQYSLEQFGLSAQQIRAAFAAYYERFDL